MTFNLNKIMLAKTNVIGTIGIACLASVLTTMATWFFAHGSLLRSPPIAGETNTVTASSVLDCENGVYSPVQRRCVSQEVFDAEMKRLFVALGIDTSVYHASDGQ